MHSTFGRHILFMLFSIYKKTKLVNLLPNKLFISPHKWGGKLQQFERGRLGNRVTCKHHLKLVPHVPPATSSVCWEKMKMQALRRTSLTLESLVKTFDSISTWPDDKYGDVCVQFACRCTRGCYLPENFMAVRRSQGIYTDTQTYTYSDRNWAKTCDAHEPSPVAHKEATTVFYVA